jgi:ATP-dependent protease HslVU (ClpYQ) peptidase subunit
MTCIIGLEANGKAYIGADSAAVSRYDIRQTITPKVFRNDGVIIGYTSSFRMGQLLQFIGIPPYVGDADEDYMINKFIEEVRKNFKEKGYSTVKDNIETGGTFIVGITNKIYTIEDDFQVQRYSDGISCVGCGQNYAYGAMKALEKIEPEKRIRKSLQIASYYSSGVCPPFNILKTE